MFPRLRSDEADDGLLAVSGAERAIGPGPVYVLTREAFRAIRVKKIAEYPKSAP